jgi:hypothetical protein
MVTTNADRTYSVRWLQPLPIAIPGELVSELRWHRLEQPHTLEQAKLIFEHYRRTAASFCYKAVEIRRGSADELIEEWRATD